MELILQGFKNNWKRYLISSLQTFVSAFLLFAMPQILEMDWNNMDSAAVYSIFLTAVRIGVKAVYETWMYKKQ